MTTSPGLRTARLGAASLHYRRPRPPYPYLKTKEARRAQSTGFLRGYSRGPWGQSAISLDPNVRRIKEKWRRDWNKFRLRELGTRFRY